MNTTRSASSIARRKAATSPISGTGASVRTATPMPTPPERRALAGQPPGGDQLVHQPDRGDQQVRRLARRQPVAQLRRGGVGDLHRGARRRAARNRARRRLHPRLHGAGAQHAHGRGLRCRDAGRGAQGDSSGRRRMPDASSRRRARADPGRAAAHARHGGEMPPGGAAWRPAIGAARQLRPRSARGGVAAGIGREGRGWRPASDARGGLGCRRVLRQMRGMRHFPRRSLLALPLALPAARASAGPVVPEQPEGAALLARLRAGGLVLYFRHADTRGRALRPQLPRRRPRRPAQHLGRPGAAQAARHRGAARGTRHSRRAARAGRAGLPGARHGGARLRRGAGRA